MDSPGLIEFKLDVTPMAAGTRVMVVVEVNVTVILWVTPLEVTVICAVPAVVLEVKETVTVPVSPGVVV